MSHIEFMKLVPTEQMGALSAAKTQKLHKTFISLLSQLTGTKDNSYTPNVI